MSTLLSGVEALAAATLIPFAADALAARVRNAGRRHLVRVAGMTALLLLPLFAALFPSEFVLRSASPSVAVATAAAPAPSAHFLGWLLASLVLLWSVGMLALLIRGLGGALALTVLLRRSEAHPFDAARLAGWAARAGLNGGWRLYLSAEIQTPISWGIVWPVVLLPEPCADWPAPKLDAAMLHELAHLRRRDSIAQAIAMLCCALYWPHPLIWAQARAQRADAEEAADNAVINSGVRQSDYADLLLCVAAAASEQRSFTGLEFSMADGPGLEARIQAVLAINSSRSGVTKMHILKTILFGTTAALALALARPSFGADPQQSPLPPQVPMPAIAATPAVHAVSPVPPVPAIQSVPSTPARKPTAVRRVHIRRPNIQWPVDAHIGDTVAKAIDRAHIDETVAKAIEDAHISEKVTAALADAHIDEKVAAAMQRVQPEIDAAIARAQRAAEAAQRANPQ